MVHVTLSCVFSLYVHVHYEFCMAFISSFCFLYKMYTCTLCHLYMYMFHSIIHVLQEVFVYLLGSIMIIPFLCLLASMESRQKTCTCTCNMYAPNNN